MAVVEYAIEIDSGASGVTNTDYACVAGVVRLITGRPGYMGAPTYPTGEAGVAAATLQGRWFEGWIKRDGIGTAARTIDITSGGQYGNLSSFSFSMENSRKWWSWADTNSVYLANKPITLYVVIGGVFYFVWSGVIREQPRTDTEMTISCVDGFKARHKQLPPIDISQTTFPDANDDAMGKCVPVCMGYVPYAELLNVSGEPDYVVLYSMDGVDSKTTTAESYFSSGALDGVSHIKLLVTPGFDPDDIDDVDSEYYLFVASGTGADTDAAYKISTANYSTRITYGGRVADLMDVGFQGAFPISPDAFNAYRNNLEDDELPAGVWMFKIARLATKNLVSTRQVSEFKTSGPNVKLIKYDTDTKKESDVSYIQSASDDGSTGNYPHIKLISRNITKGGDIQAWAGIPPDVYRRDATTGALELYFSQSNRIRGTSGGETFAVDYYVRIPTDVDWSEYSTVYLCPDFAADFAASIEPLGLKIEVSAITPAFQTIADMQYTTYYPGSAYTDRPIALTDFPLNFVPNWYYENGGDDGGQVSRFMSWETIGTFETDNATPFEIDSTLLDAIQSGDISPILKVRYTFTSAAQFSDEVEVVEMALIGQRATSITDGSVYAQVVGELIYSGYNQSVYTAFKHILETYDGIDAADIDYHNMATSRADWIVGRQLTEKKSSFDYLRELCAQSFVCTIPKRNGVMRLTAWREDDGFATIAHGESVIQRNSIKKIEKTPISKVYNVFKVKYAWHPGRSAYLRAFTVDRVDESAFPAIGTDADGDGIADWKTYVGGLNDTSYADAKALWDTAHASYLQSSAINELPRTHTDLSWFTDIDLLAANAWEYAYYTGTSSSAFLALRNFVEWTTRQFDRVEYALPLNTTNIALELLTPITFTDSLLTNGVGREGWITSIKIDPKKDRIQIESLLQPADIDTGSIDGDIVETGSAADTIDESGSRADTITEGA